AEEWCPGASRTGATFFGKGNVRPGCNPLVRLCSEDKPWKHLFCRRYGIQRGNVQRNRVTQWPNGGIADSHRGIQTAMVYVASTHIAGRSSSRPSSCSVETQYRDALRNIPVGRRWAERSG